MSVSSCKLDVTSLTAFRPRFLEAGIGRLGILLRIVFDTFPCCDGVWLQMNTESPQRRSVVVYERYASLFIYLLNYNSSTVRHSPPGFSTNKLKKSVSRTRTFLGSSEESFHGRGLRIAPLLRQGAGRGAISHPVGAH